MPAHHRFVSVLGTFAVVYFGGWLFEVLGTPLPYLLGSLAVSAILSLRNACSKLPTPGLRFGQISIGLTLGLYFTAEVLNTTVSLLPWIFFAAILSSLFSLCGAVFLQRFVGIDAATSFFSAAIGGASDMANQAATAGARADIVAIAHTVRVSLVVGSVPFLASYLFSSGNHTKIFASTPNTLEPLIIATLFIVAAIIAPLARQIRIPNPWVLGSLFVGGVCASTFVEGIPNTWVINTGQVLLGWNLGQRFSPTLFREAPRIVIGVVLMTLIYAVGGLGIATALHFGAGLSWGSSFIATTPGGIAEMAITAKVLGLDPPTVTAFHAVRLIVMVAGATSMIALGKRLGWLRA
ncbi:AbrB family transcriptional regulator [Orrella daihaiensis]|uniref:AbrB family transcriptional regulator n=1 Tax=Orrella daihaiensis TaxID=2782176 RepID=A0ABY4AMD5_9BURK|nr:AbrB family transcriptional regulator [Orrella daihaiensis]UOD50786.1 AbrB family transcriptional regulator [Orrella daihaiensis]